MDQPTVRKTYIYKLEPTPKQERELGRVLGLCRWLYNTALEQRITLWKHHGVSLSRYQQEAELKDLRAAMPEYAAIHSHVLQDVLARLDKTYQAFFRRVKQEESGLSALSGRALATTRSPTRSSGTGPRWTMASSSSRRLGALLCVGPGRSKGRPRPSPSPKRQTGGMFLLLCRCTCPALPETGQETGIDLGIEAFATLSDGTRIFSPGWYRKAERALKTAQRRVSRRKKGSNRRRKAVALLAKAHQTVRRQRQDFHHKTALALVRSNDTIYHEDLGVANMVRNHHLAKSISDAGWSQFLSILSFKAACAGRSVVAVNPAYTSQTCSGCGVMVAKGLSVRWHSCPECGTSLHRDHNAARNIERAGQALRGGAALVASENRESIGL